MTYDRALCLLMVAAVITACGKNSGDLNIIAGSDSSLLDGAIILSNNQATLHPKDTPPALITSAGDFSIDGKSIVTDPSQRALLLQYFQNVQAVHDHGIATGKAGVAVAGEAMKSVASGLASGNTDQIDKQVNAKAKLVQESALKICSDLSGIKSAQDQLSTQLPPFKPYAHIVSADQITDCMKDDDDKNDKDQ
jgi:hypothetical protein